MPDERLDMFRRAANYVGKTYLFEQPTKLELVLNARIARTLGLTLPPSVLDRVAHVIE